MQETIISDYKVGTMVNLEVDIIARYLERLLPDQQTGITVETLAKHGFIK
jgi:riboflavin synthase